MARVPGSDFSGDERFYRWGVAAPYDCAPNPAIALDERNLTMTELAQHAGAQAAPLGSSDVFSTQAERRAELRRMRTIATMLLVLMAAIYLAMRLAAGSTAARRARAARRRTAFGSALVEFKASPIRKPIKHKARSRDGRWTVIPGAYVSRWEPYAEAHEPRQGQPPWGSYGPEEYGPDAPPSSAAAKIGARRQKG